MSLKDKFSEQSVLMLKTEFKMCYIQGQMLDTITPETAICLAINEERINRLEALIVELTKEKKE